MLQLRISPEDSEFGVSFFVFSSREPSTDTLQVQYSTTVLYCLLVLTVTVPLGALMTTAVVLRIRAIELCATQTLPDEAEQRASTDIGAHVHLQRRAKT
jgi:hypothetical protein